MSVEVSVTKEITDYETKLIGPLTARQALCLGIALPICYVAIRYLTPILTRDVALFFVFIPAVFAWAFGWCRPYGMKMEQFLRAVYITRLLAPIHRRYRTVNTVEAVIHEAEEQWKREEEERLLATETSKQRRARKRAVQAQKYKPSPEAWR